RVRHCRVTDEHDNGFAFHLNSLVIFQAILWRHDSIADENEVRILDFHFRNGAPAHRDIVSLWLEAEHFLACDKRRLRLRSEPGERDLLDVAAIGIAGFESQLLKLLGEILHRELFTSGTWSASLIFVGRE